MTDIVLDPAALAAHLAGKHFIDGKLVPPAAGATFDVRSPATGVLVANAAAGDAADVDRAVVSAATAQIAWAKVPARQRGKLIGDCARLLDAHKEELSRLIALETGKALRTESRVEAGVLADALYFYAGLGSELKGETVPFNPDMLTMTIREPIGVVGAIIPWNVPMMLMALKIAPALLAGNTVVVKSAEEAPFAVLRICELMGTILPPGAFNMLSGMGPECGAPLVSHPKVGKITFTGSVETGKIVSKLAADKLIPVTLELGGKSPMIVMDDCDLDRTVAGAIAGMRFTRMGQSCTASSRMYVQAGVHDRFVAALKAKVDAMKMGDPLDETTDIGTIVSPGQFEKVKNYIAIGIADGGTANECSAMPTAASLKDGYYVRPVIFTGLPENSRVIREEIFGPVTAVIRFDTFDEAIAAANDSEYGLAATIWTKDLKTALDGARRLQAGFVQVNQNLVVQPGLSYGGVKSSGLGKEATLEAMLEHFTTKKTVIVNLA